MKRLSSLFLFAIVFFSASPVFGWSSPGHIIVAAEAYRELSPELQKRAVEILKAHPDYSKWEKSYVKSGEGMALPLFIFMRAATWPDEIKGRNGAYARYDHPPWHYVEWPLIAPKFELAPEPLPDDDAIFGAAQCEKFISDTNASPELKAVYLSFLIHIVGDMHQPLHCGVLFNSTYPKGDKGGAGFYVGMGDKNVTLRSFWSGQFGRKINFPNQLAEAMRIQSERPRKSLTELSTAATPKEWSLEGRQVALDKAYLHDELKGGTTVETALPLPEGYAKDAKVTAEKQVALAGYRLADEIGRFVK